MRRTIAGSLLAALALCASCSGAPAGAAPSGRWAGQAGPAGDRRALAVTFEGKGGSLDLESGGLLREPLTRVTAHGDSVVMVLATDLGDVVLAGRVRGERIEGRMHLGTIECPFEMTRTNEAPRPWRSEDVKIANGDVTLAGTLFFPEGKGPFPAVVFLHGSGDEARLGIGNRARVGAYLDQGIAVLVVDKRGIGGSTGDYRRVGLRELAGDGLAALRSLRGRSELRSDALGFDGRSQGSWLAVIAAAQAPEVAFVVAQVGGGVSPARQELHRIGAEMRAAGAAPASVDSAEAWVELHYAVARGDSSWERYTQVAEATRGARWLDLKRPYSSPEQARASWDRLSSYEPAPDLARLRCPLLAVLAADDRSTPTEATAKAFRESPRPPGAPPFDVRVLPRVGHELLEFPASGLPRLPDGYPALVARWVKSVTGAGP